ncbi:MAG: RodZ domain-containing protein [Candidatus Limnocylindrales bacterium]
MTARHQLRIGNRRLGRDRSAIEATRAPRVGETLQQARERKGVDLYRAERDTKIRLRYLAALEDGAYEDLPAPVYTKGFLRNYAIYLGIDPDEIIERWRDEMESMRSVERIAVAPPPMPIAAPGRRVTITPGMFVAGLVALVVLAFVGYLAVQLLRYVETTPVDVTDPQTAFLTVAATTEKYAFEGTSGPGARITVRGPGDAIYNTNANEEGDWSLEVLLSPGRNEFTVTARDPVTQRESTPVPLALVVAFPSQAPNASSATPPPPVALTLSLAGPADGFVSSDGNVVVSGSTSGTRVTISSEYLGTPVATPGPVASPGCETAPTPAPEASPGCSAAPTDTPTPVPSTDEVPLSTLAASPSPGSSLAPIGPALDITVPASGSFVENLSFAIGRWEITITTYGIGVSPVVETRTIIVAPPVTTGLVLVINVEGRNSWVRVTADGARVAGLGTLEVGEIKTINATSEICIRTGNAGGLHLNLNGLDIGLLGRAGQVGSWIIRPGEGPQPVDTPC